MPIYEYKCRECGIEFDKMVQLKDSDAPQTCPGCESTNTEKKMSACFGSAPENGSCSAPAGSPFQ